MTVLGLCLGASSTFSQEIAAGTFFAVSHGDAAAPRYLQKVPGGAMREAGPEIAGRKFAIGSNTKPMTALLVIQAEEEWIKKGGKFSLDTTLPEVARLIDAADAKRGVKRLPEHAIKVSPGFARITVRMLLSHVGGMPGDSGITAKDRSELLATIFRHGPYTAPEKDNSPGRAYAYSDQGYAVLGEILERISEPHQTYAEILQTRIFEALDMKGCGFTPHPEAVGQQAQLCAGPGGMPALAPTGLSLQPAYDSPLIDPAAGGYCTLGDWLKFVRYQMALVNKAAPAGLILKDPASSRHLLEMFPGGYYGAGALMTTERPQAAYQQGSNGDSLSLSWFERGALAKGAGTAVVGVSVGVPYTGATFGDFQSQAEALALKK